MEKRSEVVIKSISTVLDLEINWMNLRNVVPKDGCKGDTNSKFLHHVQLINIIGQLSDPILFSENF